MNTFAKTQRDWLKEAIALATEHPDLDIKFCTNSGVICEDCAWTSQEISSVKITEWYENNEGEIFIGIEDIKEEFLDYHIDYGVTQEEKDNELERLFKENVKKMICVFTD